MERALVLLKPDAYKRKLLGRIITRLEEKNFKLSYMNLKQFNKEVFEEHYSHIAHLEIFPELVSFMASAPVVVMIWEGNDVIAGIRKLMGKTKWLEAEPGTIRGDFTCNTTENLIHCSDSPENAEIEIKRFIGTNFVSY